MVEQEDIIALTKHVRSFSDALNNLRNTFKDKVDGTYDQTECLNRAHTRLGHVLKLLKRVLGKYPLLQSPDILTAASNIISKIKSYDYSDEDGEGPPDFYGAIDRLALSFSSSVSDFLMGDKDGSISSAAIDQDDDNENTVDHEDLNLMKGFLDQEEEVESLKNTESEDSIDIASSLDNEIDGSFTPDSDKISSPLKRSNTEQVTDILDPLATLSFGLKEHPETLTREESSLLRREELDKTLLSIEGSVELALKRTKIWSKYSKDLLSYIERRSNYELEYCKQIAKLATQTRASVKEESYLPLQSIFVTALENDIEFNNNFMKCYHNELNQIVEKLTNKQKEHDIRRSKMKNKWKAELKRQHESVENLKAAKKMYLHKEKELEKFNKQQLEGKEERPGFSIVKKKGQEDFVKSVGESEENYKLCVDQANQIQTELERTKAEVLLQFREMIVECDASMKSAAIDYFDMMNTLTSPLSIRYRTLYETSEVYEEGQQFADFVRLQQGTCNQARRPVYYFEPYKSESKYSFHRQGETAETTSPTSKHIRTGSNPYFDSEFRKSPSITKKTGSKPTAVTSGWSSLPRSEGSATDDTDSLSSHSPPGTPQSSPPKQRKLLSALDSDDDSKASGDIFTAPASNYMKSRKVSTATEGHKFRRLRSPSKCKECDSYVYFMGQECEQCGIVCHKKCLENLSIKCGNKLLPRKMTTFGMDFQLHLTTTQRKDIPYIIEKCIETIEENGLLLKGIYRVSGVKSKVEKLCQLFETGGTLVDLSNSPPHFVASVLKLYLRQLPEALLTFKLYQSFITVGKVSMNLKLSAIDEMSPEDSAVYKDIIHQLHNIIKELPEPNFYTAAKLIRHLRRVADRSEENQMGAANLAMVFGPTLLKPDFNASSLAAVMDMPHQSRVVELLILNSHIFNHTKEGEVDIEALTGKNNCSPAMGKSTSTLGKIERVQEIEDKSDTVESVSIETQLIRDEPPLSAETVSEMSDVKYIELEDVEAMFHPILQTASTDEVQSTTIIFSTPHTETISIIQSPIPEIAPVIGISSKPQTAVLSQVTPVQTTVVQSTHPFDVTDTINRSATKTVSGEKPNQDSHLQSTPSKYNDYDNISCLESDILDDLPGVSDDPAGHSSKRKVSGSDYIASQFSSIESLLSDDSLNYILPGSTTEMPVASSDHEETDDAWMNRFGKVDIAGTEFPKVVKQPLSKTTSSPVPATKLSSPGTLVQYPNWKRKNATVNRLETASFSFSLGKTSKTEEESIDETPVSSSKVAMSVDDLFGLTNSLSASDSTGWVKRDSKERVPVRTHLKAINVKSSVDVSDPQIESEGSNLKETPFTLFDTSKKSMQDEITDKITSNDDKNHERNNVFLTNKLPPVDQLEKVPSEATGAINEPVKKCAPPVSAKPKKALDKKSWTADLVKSKSHTMMHHPQPGSLNDKLLNLTKPKTGESE